MVGEEARYFKPHVVVVAVVSWPATVNMSE